MKPDFQAGQNIRTGDLLLPRLIVKARALEHNIERMARYCRDHGVWLAPHAKTTMAPAILERQAKAGVWGFTVATTQQARTLRRLGVERILIANQIVEPLAISWLAHELACDDQFEAFTLVDSVRGVEILDRTLHKQGPHRPIDVLIELGEPGGRAGCRTSDQVEAVARAVAATKHLRLVGLEGFEAMLEHTTSRDVDTAIDMFLHRLHATTVDLSQKQLFDHINEIIISAGGSTHYEAAAEKLSRSSIRPGLPIRTLLRPGAYATFDVQPGYFQTLEIWSVIQSRPEPDLAIAGFGRRDIPSDQLFPTPIVAGAVGRLRSLEGTAEITRLNDQHAFIALHGAEINIGDLLGCSIPYPVRPAFASWRVVPLVDDDYDIIDALHVLY